MCLFLCADHDTAINRYSRLSKKRDNDRVRTFWLILSIFYILFYSQVSQKAAVEMMSWSDSLGLSWHKNWVVDFGGLQVRAEVVEDVYTSRKKQHQTMMHYFCSLNTLQYKKKTAMLEPLLGYMQAQVPTHTHTNSN